MKYCECGRKATRVYKAHAPMSIDDSDAVDYCEKVNMWLCEENAQPAVDGIEEEGRMRYAKISVVQSWERAQEKRNNGWVLGYYSNGNWILFEPYTEVYYVNKKDYAYTEAHWDKRKDYAELLHG